jgi:hypothetical protein
LKIEKSISRWSMLFVMLGLAALCSRADSTIRVHMIDARTGSPIANSPARLWAHDTAEQRNVPGFVQKMTDSNGVATFDLKEPVPSYLFIHIGMGAPWEECFPDAQSGFVTDQILGSGLSKESACWKLPNIASKFHPSPGDVYIFAVRDTLVQRVKAVGH